MEKYLMGIDAGNTASKVVIFDLYGKMIATAATPSMHFKRRGEGFEEFDVTELCLPESRGRFFAGTKKMIEQFMIRLEEFFNLKIILCIV